MLVSLEVTFPHASRMHSPDRLKPPRSRSPPALHHCPHPSVEELGAPGVEERTAVWIKSERARLDEETRFIEAASTVRLMEDKGETAQPVTGQTKLDRLPVSCSKSCLFDGEISCNSVDINTVFAWKWSWASKREHKETRSHRCCTQLAHFKLRTASAIIWGLFFLFFF